MLPIIITCILANVISRGPDAALFLTTPQGQWFTGQASMFDPWDTNVYLTAINWGRQGHLLLNNRYDATDPTSALLYPVYTLLGFATKPFPIGPAVVFHLAGILISCLLIKEIYTLTKLLLPKAQRLPAFIVALFGGGLGWIITELSADVAHSGFTLHAALRTPHEGLSLLLLLVAIKKLYQSKPLPFLLAIVGIVLIHPYMLLPLAIIAAIINRRFLIPLSITAPLYYVLIGRSLLNNASFYSLFHQIHIPLTIPEVIFGFGLLLIPILTTLHHRPKNRSVNLLLIWFFTQLALIFLPFPFARLFARGLWIPASFLASYGIVHLTKKTYRHVFVFLCCFSTLFIFYRRISNLGPSPWVRLSQDEHMIMQKMPCATNTVVLASHPLTSIIPTKTECRVYAGHQVQTPNFADRFKQVTLLYAGQLSQTGAIAFLEASHADYIMWGPQEQLLGRRNDFPYPELVIPLITTPKAILYEYNH